MNNELKFINPLIDSKHIYKTYYLSPNLDNIYHIIMNFPHITEHVIKKDIYKNFINDLLLYASHMRKYVDSFIYPSNFIKHWSDTRHIMNITLKTDINILLGFIIRLENMNIPEYYILS